VNNDSGRADLRPHPAGIPIHIAPESAFTISRNAYSHGPEYGRLDYFCCQVTLESTDLSGRPLMRPKVVPSTLERSKAVAQEFHKDYGFGGSCEKFRKGIADIAVQNRTGCDVGY